ncbi:SAM-dependent methyltransferase [Mycolicibacterium bacteremicum]|uniref:S-adenosyl-L-methionine-dependent methyltransferase n=1 Tax=Mycolicibacterium bacteremicum TaxID=564198 RepID=A0A1W9Z404_MYCBA|nr:class I SAM-dependent methyltransferase [Mycolicibacterium bacteremicum]MCV7431770.1 class I SAM-dependent methyltransferase [Mycolicibacterium bacteremicum]ORA06760.1 SAM-dependent methyltransferase [Mycolicibacterium bacteremicum]
MARSEGDTWDLASSVGATATSVAASRALASRGPNPLIHDPYAAALVEAVGLPHFVRVANGELGDQADPLFGADQMREHIAVRTRFFDDFFAAAVGDSDPAPAVGDSDPAPVVGDSDPAPAVAGGVRQAVILASGLDTRAYRLDWPDDTVVFEIDQPAVIDFKTRVLAEAGAELRIDRRTVGIDLREDWPAALREAGFDPSAPTAWIAEGLLIYLPPEAQDRLLDDITALSAPGSSLATEHMDAKALTGDWAKELSERGRRYGSDIDLNALFYNGPRTPAGDHLRAAGWQVTVLSNDQAYAANGFERPNDRLVAMVGDSGYLQATWRGHSGEEDRRLA